MDQTMSLPRGILLDERDPNPFRNRFGQLLARSRRLETAIHRVRLSRVDFTSEEVRRLDVLRVLVAEVNAGTLEEEAFALLADPRRRPSLGRILELLHSGRMDIRSAPLAGWSPDFSVFSGPEGPQALLLGLHWFQRPFPHRGPAWAVAFGPREAALAHRRFREIWSGAHDIGPAVLGLLERGRDRWAARSREGGRGGREGEEESGVEGPGTPVPGEALPGA